MQPPWKLHFYQQPASLLPASQSVQCFCGLPGKDWKLINHHVRVTEEESWAAWWCLRGEGWEIWKTLLSLMTQFCKTSPPQQSYPSGRGCPMSHPWEASSRTRVKLDTIFMLPASVLFWWSGVWWTWWGWKKDCVQFSIILSTTTCQGWLNRVIKINWEHFSDKLAPLDAWASAELPGWRLTFGREGKCRLFTMTTMMMMLLLPVPSIIAWKLETARPGSGYFNLQHVCFYDFNQCFRGGIHAGCGAVLTDIGNVFIDGA